MAERQYGKYISDIRGDHTERYAKAARIVQGRVLDAAAGCGYGSYILCLKNRSVDVLGVDYSDEALDYAHAHWKHERNRFGKVDLQNDFVAGRFEWLVSFETIEHLKDPTPFLAKAAKVCANIVCSVPNQDILPYCPKRFDFHHRHYTPAEITELLKVCGWEVTKTLYQHDVEARGLRESAGRTIWLQGRSTQYQGQKA